MFRALTVMALFAATAAWIWCQAEPPSTAARDEFATIRSPVSNTAPSHTYELPSLKLATPIPGGRPLPQTVSNTRQLPVASPTRQDPDEPGDAIRQTAFYESTEPLPPGVDYPEGPQLLRSTTVNTASRLPPSDAANQSPRLLDREHSAQETGAPAPENQFVELLCGADLNGWTVQDGKPEAWSADRGVLHSTQASGGWLRTNREYSDFELRLDVKLAAGANSGIGFRFPNSGSPTVTGFEVQLIDDAAPKYSELRHDQHTGSLYYQVPPLQQFVLPIDEWVPVQLYVRGDRIRVDVNGVTVNDLYLDQLPVGEQPHPLRSRPTVGFVGLQSSGSPVEFRNIRIHDLGSHFESGLTTVDLSVGTGDVCPAGARITVEYSGRLADGTPFDSSYDRGEPLTVHLNDVIDGWQAGIPGMRVGGRRKLVVPAALAYGDAGVKDLVPPGATLVFEVELRGIER